MANLSDCSSIFQLGFGLNAIIPALLAGLHRTGQSLETAFARALRDPTFNLGLDEKEANEYAHFIVQGARGFRLARRILLVPGALMMLALLVSFWGLWAAATTPQKPISNETLLWFCILCLFVCPIIGILYEVYLRWFEERIVATLIDRSNWTAQDIARFRDLKQIKQMIEDATRETNEFLYEMARKDLRRKAERIRRNVRQLFRELRHPIRSVRKWMELRGLRKRKLEYGKTADGQKG